MAETGSRGAGGKGDAPEPVRVCVGIGAASLSLPSLERFFRATPADLAAAFVVAVRRAEGFTPPVLERIAAAAKLPVKVAEQGERLERGRIYLADEAGVTTVVAGEFRIAPPDETAGQAGALDSLLISVAEHYEEGAVAVVLPGLAGEGVAALAATKRCGGLGLAEASDSTIEPAGHVITAEGLADLRLPAEQIPEEIARYLEILEALTRASGGAQRLQAEVDRHIARVSDILRNATGADFHGYKRPTFLRRIQRRMQVVQVAEVEAYIERLERDAREVQNLFQDLLIGVTQFFRDPQEFEFLEREVIPRLFEHKGPRDRVRVWAMGCATGEEAYSLAVLLREHVARLESPPQVQIFATDVDARALALARAGRYPESISRQISPERLTRWFVKEGATYCVGRELREMCVFSPHNLLRDAPFSRIDLLSCRNLLIYLDAELQNRVIPIFHFAIRQGGYLFLGPAENVARRQKLFAPLDRKNRVFRRLDTITGELPDLPLNPSGAPSASPEGTVWRGRRRQGLSGRIGWRVEQVAERYAPAYVVVGETYDVLHFSGRTGRFLEPAAGAASLNLLSLVHRDLRAHLRTALQAAAADKQKVEQRGIRAVFEGQARVVNLVVEPISPGAGESAALVVLFQDAGPAVESREAESCPGADQRPVGLEAELRLNKEQLQSTIEELESANEELRSSDEEYQSINEELQSVNEELETSKEELQAVGEELQTVNGELAHRVAELGHANSDLKNLLESTQIATVFLDNELRVRSFTPACAEVFHLMEADLGRPIAHVSARVAYPELQEDVRKVLNSLGSVEREVAASDADRQFLVRVLPYRSIDNFIAGVVITFLEITGTAQAEAALRASERRFSEAQQLAGIGVWEWNLDTDETWWSPVVYQLWGVPPGEAPPAAAARPVHAEDRKAYDAARAKARETGELRTEWRVVLPDRSVRWLEAIGRLERAGGGRRMLGVTQDVTERKRTETRLKLLLGELQHRVRNILGVVRSIVHRTVRNATDMDELASHLDGRLDTLARTHSVFTRSGDVAIDLEEMVRDEMLAVAARDEQVSVDGPSVRLRREAAETFALAVHELTTNAVKYGALSRAEGKVAVSWRVVRTSAGPRLSLEWRESGVPAVNVNPARNGFGRELIERGLPYELGAATALDFARGGVRALIELPLTDKVAVLDQIEVDEAVRG